jgi:surfactin synthase thioesterase subunit
MQTSPWIAQKPLLTARARLFCFPYAGGGAHAYASWQNSFAPDIEVCAIQLPGRGRRFCEAALSSWEPLLDELCRLFIKPQSLPFAFFGHSMGGLIAYELAHRIRDLYRAAPLQLIISACSAPGHRLAQTKLHELKDSELVEALGKYNGTPREILENPELLALLLPTIRADFSLVEKYSPQAYSPLDCPITLLSGVRDTHVSEISLTPWKVHTSGSFTHHRFDGDHFFIRTKEQEVIALVSHEMRKSKGLKDSVVLSNQEIKSDWTVQKNDQHVFFNADHHLHPSSDIAPFTKNGSFIKPVNFTDPT